MPHPRPKFSIGKEPTKDTQRDESTTKGLKSKPKRRRKKTNKQKPNPGFDCT